MFLSCIGRLCAGLGASSLVAAVAAASAAAASAPGLPRTYQVQRIDTPNPALTANFGGGMINIGDVSGDGEDDIVTVQTQGSTNNDGVIMVHSGETGEFLRELEIPDSGATAGALSQTRSIGDPNVDRLPDIGSCTSPPPGADKTCTTPSWIPDGKDEILVGAQGIDVGGVPDVGRVYVLDGATLAVLKRIDMPAADRAEAAARRAENPGLSPALTGGGFGRTVQVPRGLPPCAVNGGVGDCPSMPTPVRIGDMDPVQEVQRITIDATSGAFTLTFQGQTTANIAFNATTGAMTAALVALSNLEPGDVVVTSPAAGTYDVTFANNYSGVDVAQMTATDVSLAGGADTISATTVTQGRLGKPEIIVGANRFNETSATANPNSQCAKSGAPLCEEAGRLYIYRSEDIVGSDPAAILDTPWRTVRNPVAQSDGRGSRSDNNENFGHVQIPIGDVGRCSTAGIQPGELCPQPGGVNVPDGKADVVIGAHRADTPIFDPDHTHFDVGVMLLFDGATGSVLGIFHHPEPQPGSGFGFSLHNPFAAGDLGPSSAPDLPDASVAAFRQNVGGHTGVGRAYLMNGNFRAGPNAYNFGQLNDPTPTIGGNFGSALTPVGDLVPSKPKNELLIGGFGSAASRFDTVNDLNFFNALNEEPLQQIQDPDQQNGSAFGSRVVPLGDLNEDGFLDFVAAANRWDTPGGIDNNQGRIYIFRSDNSPAPALDAPVDTTPLATPTPQPPAPVTPTAQAPPITPAVTRSARSITLRASPRRVARGARIRLTGQIDAVVAASGCEGAQTVALQRARTARGGFRTFKRVRSSASGVFRLTLKAARTFVFRAEVSQTASCLRAVSTQRRVVVRSRR